MRKTRVKALKTALPRRIFRGEVVGLTKREVRKAERVYVRMRAGMTHATNGDRRRLFDLSKLGLWRKAKRTHVEKAKADRKAKATA